MDQTWQPPTEVLSDTVTAGAAAALHGLLDSPGEPPRDGDPVPPLWHWLAFLPRVPQRQLGDDGHPKRGTFLPPIELPRRMFAGGRFIFEGVIGVGEPLIRRSRVASIDEKEGRSGKLVFVTVRHEIGSEDGAPAIVEEQDLVYRGPAATTREPPAEPAESTEWPWSWDMAIDPTVLFRFSALTYNAHRIHYDRPFATEVEGYPGLVVHGPLQAVALAELCRRHRPEERLSTFRFRAVRACFDDVVLKLRGRSDGDRAELQALGHGDQTTMKAEAGLIQT
jgi:3-methylfumaryl-CoA hydratase